MLGRGGFLMNKLLYGRELCQEEIPTFLWPNLSQYHQRQAGVKNKGKYICRRCNQQMTIFKEQICSCSQPCGYCTHCINLRKLKICTPLYSLPEKNDFKNDSQAQLLKWTGNLSAQQSQASLDIIKSIQDKKDRLLWAVAGAGKTEMLFLGIEHALKNGSRIAIVSPRVDVCLELYPRLDQAFPMVPKLLIYGKMKESYRYTPFVLATTHQLLRFKEAFDLIVIDEVDAFPFHNDQTLYFASKKALKKDGLTLYLTATPDQKMQTRVKNGDLAASILPARYHGHSLPVPKAQLARNWKETLLKHPKQSVVYKKLKHLIQLKRRFLVFLPNIQWMLRFEKQLRVLFSDVPFEAVHSTDPARESKVLKMREKSVQFLLTTSILERGVTFPDIDVLVVGAEDQIFTESALVQISGRVGRSPKFPTGEVIFYHNGWTKAMRQSIQQIKWMNMVARKRGLLNE